MLTCKGFEKICKKYGFTFFTGIPDSTFKSWMSFLQHDRDGLTHILPVNECEAVAICTGYYLSTGKIATLYMQNDGFGKAVNPLTSLCDPKVYSIPILLMIGWRGEPGKNDAWQHYQMGKIILPLLELLDIPYEMMPADEKRADDVLREAKDYMQKQSKSFAIIVRKGIFEDILEEDAIDVGLMSREEALSIAINHLDNDAIIVSTTGKLSRELFEYRCEKNVRFDHDFYNIGAMGCAQSIALEIALEKRNKQVFIFDGDGAVLMQMGALATIGHYAPENLHHIVFDNRAHDSTGGQSTCSDTVDFVKVAQACGYRYGKVVDDKYALKETFHAFTTKQCPSMLVIRVKKGARKDLGRPDKPLVVYKKDFMKSLVDST